MSNEIGRVPSHFIVFVPGIMGSKLRDRTTGNIIWVDFSSLPVLNPWGWDPWLSHLLDTVAYPNKELEPAGIIDEVVFVPPWVKQEGYGRFLTALEHMGYRADPARHPEHKLNVHTFAYDWRQDNRLSARQLGEAIDHWRSFHPGAQVWILAHSMGGLVSRWYIEKEGGKDYVSRLLLLASPWDGSPKAMDILFDGLDMLFRRLFNLFNIGPRTRALIRTFPSVYQLLPYQDPFLRGLNNEPVDPFNEAVGWLENDQQRPLLLDGRCFNEELGTNTSVEETLCFFGRKTPTTTSGLVRFAGGGQWSDIEWSATEAGDGTVPERSAVHPQAKEQLPFIADHGNIYIAPAVLEFLRWELIDRFRIARKRAFLVTERLQIVFKPDRDVYSPGEEINLWATVHEKKESLFPVSRASIKVQLHWREALPGTKQVPPPQDLPETRLRESKMHLGRYEGSLVAPTTEGYYQLRGRIKVVGEQAVILEELIAIELMPEVPTA
jgi:pimeloyl-ACP methyl ester carboxylesterase